MHELQPPSPLLHGSGPHISGQSLPHVTPNLKLGHSEIIQQKDMSKQASPIIILTGESWKHTSQGSHYYKSYQT